MCAFNAEDLPESIGFLVWSENHSAHTTALGRPRAVLFLPAPNYRKLMRENQRIVAKADARLRSKIWREWKRRDGGRGPDGGEAGVPAVDPRIGQPAAGRPGHRASVGRPGHGPPATGRGLGR